MSTDTPAGVRADITPKKERRMNIPRTIIDVNDTPSTGAGAAACHIAKTVNVNGQEVLLEPDGFDISFGPDEPTVVTLRMLPTEIHFGRAPADRHSQTGARIETLQSELDAALADLRKERQDHNATVARLQSLRDEVERNRDRCKNWKRSGGACEHSEAILTTILQVDEGRSRS